MDKKVILAERKVDLKEKKSTWKIQLGKGHSPNTSSGERKPQQATGYKRTREIKSVKSTLKIRQRDLHLKTHTT